MGSRKSRRHTAKVPGGFTAAPGAGPLHAPEDSSMSQTLSRAGPSQAYSGKPGKSLMDIVGTYLNCTDL